MNQCHNVLYFLKLQTLSIHQFHHPGQGWVGNLHLWGEGSYYINSQFYFIIIHKIVQIYHVAIPPPGVIRNFKANGQVSATFYCIHRDGTDRVPVQNTLSLYIVLLWYYICSILKHKSHNIISLLS